MQSMNEQGADAMIETVETAGGRLGPELRGAVAGVIATVPMTLVMLLWHRNLPKREQYALPPRIITDHVSGERTARAPKRAFGDRRSLLAHFGFGAATGSLFSVLRGRRSRDNAVLAGIGYGLTIWGASYLGWVPASGAMAPANQQPPARNTMMIVAHIVWGAALGIADQVLSGTKRST